MPDMDGIGDQTNRARQAVTFPPSLSQPMTLLNTRPPQAGANGFISSLFLKLYACRRFTLHEEEETAAASFPGFPTLIFRKRILLAEDNPETRK